MHVFLVRQARPTWIQIHLHHARAAQLARTVPRLVLKGVRTVRWVDSRAMPARHRACSVGWAHMHHWGHRIAPSVPQASRTTMPMPRPRACRVPVGGTPLWVPTRYPARAQLAASAARLATPIWMVQAHRARYAGLASTQLWVRHRAHRVLQARTIMTETHLHHV